MERPRSWPAVAQAALALLIVLAGCGTLPTAPVVERPAAATAEAPAATDDGLLGLPLPLPLPTVIEQTLTKTVAVVGALGTEIKVADVKLTVPKDAIDGSAEIKLSVPDSTKLECHLEITPASKNHFDKPVVLEFDASGARDVRTMAIYWYDESAAQWVEIPCTVDVTGKKVRADLSHFSKYQCSDETQGKAGW